LIATHSPILMALPNSTICVLDKDGIRATAYEDTEHFRVTADFIRDPEAYLATLADD